MAIKTISVREEKKTASRKNLFFYAYNFFFYAYKKYDPFPRFLRTNECVFTYIRLIVFMHMKNEVIYRLYIIKIGGIIDIEQCKI